MQHLISANIHFLDQAERLLRAIGDPDYVCPVESFYASTLGQHFRHCLDHYNSFLNGLVDSRIDYDARPREVSLETSTDFAHTELVRIRRALRKFCDQDHSPGVQVKLDCGVGVGQFQPSTLGRELQFLASHTVHHFAMIGGMCSCLGITCEKDFGVAPSTLRHFETAID